MQRVGLLNGTNENYDKDFTAGLLASVTSGIIEGFDISGSGATAELTPGKALIECTRTNGEKFMAYFESTVNVPVDLSGTKKVYIVLNQSKIDDGSSNNQDGTGIGVITTNSSYPSLNFVKLYSITSGVSTDERIAVKSKLLRKGQTPYKISVIDGNGDETLLDFGAIGTALVSTGLSSLPTWQSPSANITGLTELTTINSSDELMVYQTSTAINKKIKHSNLFDAFGNGSDGNVTITTTVTLTRDMYYDTLTINSPGVLDPNGFKIFCKNGIYGNGIIRRNGNAGSNGSYGSGGGGAGGVALNQGSLNADLGGAYGGSQGVGANGVSVNPSYTTINGVNGGGGGSFAGGTGGTSTRGALYNVALTLKQIISLLTNPPSSLSSNLFASVQYKGPSSSGGGASYGTGSTYGGGGSGGNGGVIFICARTFNFTGTIESKGGNGGNSYNPGNNRGGGGGGGQGGVVYLIGTTYTSIGTHVLTGGNAGAFLAQNGNAGVTIQITI